MKPAEASTDRLLEARRCSRGWQRQVCRKAGVMRCSSAAALGALENQSDDV
jgi:hypothetical protein